MIDNEELRNEAAQAANDLAKARLMGPNAIPVDLEAIENLLERVSDESGPSLNCEDCDDALSALGVLRDAAKTGVGVQEALRDLLANVSGTNEDALAEMVAAAMKGSK